jgi:hypothetical protein
VAEALVKRLDELRPKRILEVGSGVSTLVLASYATHSGAEVVTLEHMRTWHDRTKVALARYKLSDHVDLRYAPLKRQRFRHRLWRFEAPWYDVELPNPRFDFAFVDGPPMYEGREAVLPAVIRNLAPGWELWMDDGQRDHERRCVDLWKEQRYRFDDEMWELDKGVLVLRDPDAGSAKRTSGQPAGVPLFRGVAAMARIAVGALLPAWPLPRSSSASPTTADGWRTGRGAVRPR